MKYLLLFVCFVFVLADSKKLCPSHTNCKECADATACKWCPQDKKCHTVGSLVNPCKSFDNVGNSTWCSCHQQVTPQCCLCKPEQGWPVKKLYFIFFNLKNIH